MPYCVHCGVELDKTAQHCPLCFTPVLDPQQPVDTESSPPFPTQRKEVQPVTRWELALLLTVMLASAAICCGVVNLFLHSELGWSLYVIGGALVIWVWMVPPLLVHGLPLLARMVLDVAAVGIYVFLISLDVNHTAWFMGLALPIILTAGALAILAVLFLWNGHRSILTATIVTIAWSGVFVILLELYIDRFQNVAWSPSWSLVVAIVCVALLIPLIIVRRVPSLRETMRRRFHM